MIQRLLDAELPGVELVHVCMRLSTRMEQFTHFRLSKVMRMFRVIVRIIHARLFLGARILYYTPAGPLKLSMYRDLVILLSTRWMFDKTIFHFLGAGLSELYDQLPRWQQRLFRWSYFEPDAAIRLSSLTPEDGKHLEAKREYLIPNGFDDPCPDLVLPRARVASTAPRPLRILFVGILRESKGLLVLVEACGMLAARGVAFQLNIMGAPDSDEFISSLRARVAELNIDNQVHFLGVLTGDEKFAVYRASDVHCMPTFYECEAFPLALIEAMACGLPVTATRWRGIPSMVDEGETGFLVEPHDVAAVADRLERLANDPQLRERMSVAARNKFLRNYTASSFARRMRRVVLDVAGETDAFQVEEPYEDVDAGSRAA
jgi:glycosyltransferase involved in cell wall biosynthesis